MIFLNFLFFTENSYDSLNSRRVQAKKRTIWQYDKIFLFHVYFNLYYIKTLIYIFTLRAKKPEQNLWNKLHFI